MSDSPKYPRFKELPKPNVVVLAVILKDGADAKWRIEDGKVFLETDSKFVFESQAHVPEIRLSPAAHPQQAVQIVNHYINPMSMSVSEELAKELCPQFKEWLKRMNSERNKDGRAKQGAEAQAE